MTVKTRKDIVAAPSVIPSNHFRLHMSKRHMDSLAKGQRSIPPQGFTYEVEQMYRAMHNVAHRRADNGELELDHQHEPEPEDAAILFALHCLLQNRLWGWREIAGYPGRVVSAFPNGVYATRIDNVVRHHRSAEEAAERLIGD